MLSKLIKVLITITTIILILLQVDLSLAFREDFRRDRKLSLFPLILDHNNTDLSDPILKSLSTEAGTQDSSWEQILPTQSPEARYLHGMTYDSNNNATVLFGGDPDGKGHDRLGDTWEYEGGNWNQISTALSPLGRVNINQAMVHDQAHDRIVLFGGLSQTGHQNDTWEYYEDGAIHVWEPITPTVKPMMRDTHAMVYDSTRELTVMFGGWSPIEPGFYLQDTWEYDGNNWFNQTTGSAPTARHQHALAYDSQRGVVVLFGGRDTPTTTLNDTWEYDGTNWYQVPTANSPSPRSSHGMAYDAERRVVVLFGGLNGDGSKLFNDTWEYDGSNWVQVDTWLSPIERYGTPLVYDNQREKMVFFGGGVKNGNFHTSDETWEYTGASEEISPLVVSALANIGMPYDIDRGCSSPYSSCGGPYHGFFAGVCTDIVLDAYKFNSDIPFDIQVSLYQDHINNPGRYRYGTARYAEDLRRYFGNNQALVVKTEPYMAGDIAFFDWEGDGLSDQVAVISEVDSSGNPLAVVDATGYYSNNLTGRAMELSWDAYLTYHVLEHARVDNTTPIEPLPPNYSGPALRVILDGDEVNVRLWDADGKYITDSYDENYAASNVDEFIPYIPGGYYSDIGAQQVITVTNPISGSDYFIEINADETLTYNIQVELLEGSSLVDSDVYNQSINIGETHLIPLVLNISAGRVDSSNPTLSPRIGTPTSLEISGSPESTPQLSTNIIEFGGDLSIDNAHISATNLTNQMGETINGAQIAISPSDFKLSPGGTKEVTVQVDLSGVLYGMYQGSLLLTSDNGYPVSIPLTIWVKDHSIYLPIITK